MISNVHNSDKWVTKHARKPKTPPKRKPKVIDDYNLGMDGVDISDQYSVYYNFEHGSVKWWRKEFFHFVEMAVVNSYILYRCVQEKCDLKPMSHKKFRRTLIKELVPMKDPGPGRRRSGPELERLDGLPHFPEKTEKHRECLVCSDRKEGVRFRNETIYLCYLF